ncbi:MAG: FAD-dependent monooxygenase, partial [Rhodospirillaceae bacterium]|nr:FAD-dependent monooxygenase [Rhodospirillaceae bacterium]
PPSLEMMKPLGFTDYLLANGIKVPRWQFRDLHEGVVAEFDLGLLAKDTEYPFRLHCEQWKLTQHGYAALKDRPGIEFLMGHEVTGAEQTADKVVVTCKTAEGERKIEGRWLVGADGGRSVIRKLLGFTFEGFTWDEMFVVVSTYHDFKQHGFTENAYIADPDHWCGVFKMPGFKGEPELWRFAYGADPKLSDEAVLTQEATDAAMQQFQKLPHPYRFSYKSTYRVHQRVVDTFRKGRVLLAGDAAHINNPMGALGMNSGIQDAANLAEKLAKVWKGEADDSLLGRYDRQRRTIANEIVQTMSTNNLKRLLERDPAVRKKNRDEMRAIHDDPKRHYDFVLGSSMIASVRRAATIQ